MHRRAILSAAVVAASLPGLARAGAKPDKKKGGGETYIQIPPLAATVNMIAGRRAVMTVETGVDVPDEALRVRCEQSLPRLRAAYVQVLQVYAASLRPLSAPNADFLAAELQRETDRVLGRKGARLLLGTILIN